MTEWRCRRCGLGRLNPRAMCECWDLADRLLVWFIVILIIAMGLYGELSAQTDGSREPTCISVVESDLPGAFQHPPFTDCVQAADTWRDARLINTHPASFRHFHYVSGPEACIFNVQINGDHEWTDPGGGRTCGAGINSGQCGYYSTGWNIVLASGQSCAGYGVPSCTGPLCF